MSLSRLSVVFAAWFALAVAGHSQAYEALRGEVFDPVGVAMPRAVIVVRADLRGNDGRVLQKLVQLTTNDRGRFERVLPPGFYDVCVMYGGFKPQCRKVRVSQGRGADVKFKMRVDRLTSVE